MRSVCDAHTHRLRASPPGDVADFREEHDATSVTRVQCARRDRAEAVGGCYGRLPDTTLARVPTIAKPESRIYTAYQISVGQSFPLEGPVLGGAVHGGPACFYLLAIPLAIHKPWLAVALFAGTIAGLKLAHA
jgi:hypothetical protein